MAYQSKIYSLDSFYPVPQSIVDGRTIVHHAYLFAAFLDAVPEYESAPFQTQGEEALARGGVEQEPRFGGELETDVHHQGVRGNHVQGGRVVQTQVTVDAVE